MNIFHSNVDTLKSALYFKTPKPKVSRRFKTNDPIGRTIAEVVERGLQYQLDIYDFDNAVKKAIEDMLIVGRGAMRLRYDPVLVTGEPERIPVTVEPITGIGEVAPGQMGEVQVAQRLLDPDGNEVDQENVKQDSRGMFIEGDPVEFIGEQSITCEHVNWSDLTISPARCWQDVKWIAFRHLLSRQDLVDYYGSQGEQIPLSARIVALCDVYDALRSERPYKPAWPAERAQTFILEQSGKHFDPTVVEVMASLFDEIELVRASLSDE